MRLVGSVAVKGDRAAAAVDVLDPTRTKRMQLYLTRTQGRWSVANADFDTHHPRRYLAGGSLSGVHAPSQVTPEDTVETWFDAVAARSKDAALALFTPEARAHEEASDNSFTYALFSEGLTVKSWRISGASAQGSARRVQVRAVLVDGEDKSDNEGMTFVLSRQAGKWWITDLR